MEVGDKVRMVHGREEGIVTRILDENLIEVEIEDGFLIPVLRKEVVVIDQAESTYFRGVGTKEPVKAELSKSDKKKIKGKEGLYIAYKSVNDQLYSVYLINALETPILYSAKKVNKNAAYIPLKFGVLNSNESVKIDQNQIKDFEQWLPVHISAMAHSTKEQADIGQRWEFTLKPKASSFYRNKQLSPVLESNAHLFKLQPTAIQTIAASTLQDKIGNATNEQVTVTLSAPANIIDLHIEKLSDKHQQLSPQEKLDFQVETFEKTLAAALATGMQEITFIHGVGNGKLKYEIQKKLSKQSDVLNFKDALKEKFGYGATLVRIKA